MTDGSACPRAEQHYLEAERLLEVAREDVNIGGDLEKYSVAAAQVHATLALAAATIEIAAVTLEVHA